MGRPPIGKTAMTGAERVARYRAKHAPPKPSSGDVQALQAEVERLRAENAELRRQAAGHKPDEVERLRAELRYEQNAKNDLRMTNRELREKLKVKEELPKDVATLQQQLTGAKTQIRNFNWKYRHLAEALDQARRANPVTISKAELRKLQKALHPDGEGTASAARQRQLNEAFRIFSAIKIQVRED